MTLYYLAHGTLLCGVRSTKCLSALCLCWNNFESLVSRYHIIKFCVCVVPGIARAWGCVFCRSLRVAPSHAVCLQVLSDLREGLWSLAHGTTVASPLLSASLAHASGNPSPDDHEPPAEEGRMPASFYVEYGQRHLERFRKSLRDPRLEEYAQAAEA